jgi:SAM-dependent methyltransferase
MRPILPRGGRGRKLLGRLGRPFPGPVKRRMQDSLARLDYRREERAIAQEVEAKETESGPADGIPVPPPLLRVRVTGSHADRDEWLAASATDAELIRATLERNTAPLEEMQAFLDFGCGCGRVARHWAGLEGPAIHGTDVSRQAVHWCRRNLPFMRTVRCGPEPPLEYGDGAFDFVYALSVLTHLTEEGGRRWLAELVRVIKPRGLLLFTVHGERFLDQLEDADDVTRFRRGEAVVVERPLVLAGTNSFASFHPPEYVKGDLLPSVGVDLVEAVYEDTVGGGLTPMPVQDNYLVRKRAAAPRAGQ